MKFASLLCLLCAPLAMAAAAEPDVAAARSKADILQLAGRVADWQLARMSNTDGISRRTEETANTRGWEQGAFWVGMTHLADATSDTKYREAILAQGRANQWQLGLRTYHADDHVIGQSYVWAARNGAGRSALEPLRAAFDAVLAKPARVHLSFYFSDAAGYDSAECLKRWCWCDAVFMSPPAWLELSQQTGDSRYTEFALSEFWATTDFLYDPAESLYFRDSRFFERRDAQGRKLFWSRGNGWVFAGIANMLQVLPKKDARRPHIETLFRNMAAKLVKLQKADGYWPPSLLAPEGSPPESSGTGFFVYGLAWGVRSGLLDAKDYRPAIDRGWAALERAVAADGRLGWVQQVSDRPENVAESDTQYYGVGAFLLAAGAVASLQPN